MVEAASPQCFDGHRDRDDSIHMGNRKLQQKICERACEPFHPEEFIKMNGFRERPGIKSIIQDRRDRGRFLEALAADTRVFRGQKNGTHLHESPEYLFIEDQQSEQIGAWGIVSEGLLHAGHVDG